MNCDECRTELEEASLHRLPGDEARAHIEACAACRAFHEERSALRQLLGELEVVAAPSTFDAQLRARIVAKQSVGRFSVQPSFAPSALSIALAACFMLTVSAVLLFQPTQSPQRNVRTFAEPASPTNSSAARPATSPTIADAASSSWREAADAALDAQYSRVKLTSLAQPRRATHTAARLRRLNAVFVATEKPINSESFSVSSAQAVTPLAYASLDSQASSDGQSLASPTDALLVRVSPHPFEVTLLDERGVARSVSVEPVSFGATQLAGRSSDAKLTSLSSGQGIW